MNLSYVESILLLALAFILITWAIGLATYSIYRPYHNKMVARFWMQASHWEKEKFKGKYDLNKLKKKYRMW